MNDDKASATFQEHLCDCFFKESVYLVTAFSKIISLSGNQPSLVYLS